MEVNILKCCVKKMAGAALILGLLIAVTGCGKQSEQIDIPEKTESPPIVSEPPAAITSPQEETEDISQKDTETEDMPQEPEDVSEPPEAEGNSNILIAYFTWAENTYVADPDSVDVDATTSASVLIPGNVGLLAKWIQEETGGDTFSIITEEAYSSDYDTCLNRATREHDSGARPAITGHVDNMEDYDIVFLGFPNWWYSCPMAILTFIEEHDLSGKTIVPFCSHGTGGFAASLRDIGAVLPDDCVILTEFGAYRPEVASSQDKLLDWLAGLELSY